MSSNSESPEILAGDSRRFDAFSDFVDSAVVEERVHVDLPSSFNNGVDHDDGVFEDTAFVTENGNGVFLPPEEVPIHGSGDEYSSGYSPVGNGGAVNGVFVAPDVSVLPEIQEEGVLLREWRRQNAILLEQKEEEEKEILSQIIEEADGYKIAFAEKRRFTCKNNKDINREKEKLFLANHVKFHEEADKNYWKSIAELIPNEIPSLEKKRKKDEEKRPAVVVIQGPKPGKPTDLSRLRHILLKLKHEAPQHLKLSAPPAAAATKETEASNSSAVSDSAEVAVVS